MTKSTVHILKYHAEGMLQKTSYYIYVLLNRSVQQFKIRKKWQLFYTLKLLRSDLGTVDGAKRCSTGELMFSDNVKYQKSAQIELHRLNYHRQSQSSGRLYSLLPEKQATRHNSQFLKVLPIDLVTRKGKSDNMSEEEWGSITTRVRIIKNCQINIFRIISLIITYKSSILKKVLQFKFILPK